MPAEICARADPEQLHRTITNLVRNARQAIEAPTKTGAITLKADENDTQWIIDVTDTGLGLIKQVSGHLFQALQGRSRAGGAGLGSAISQELIRRHGGKIEFLKADENGTCFCVFLPKGQLSYEAS